MHTMKATAGNSFAILRNRPLLGAITKVNRMSQWSTACSLERSRTLPTCLSANLRVPNQLIRFARVLRWRNSDKSSDVPRRRISGKMTHAR